VYLNRAWAEADLRIATGFIEPHFFAGFSGGGKAVVPGVAGLDTILRLHRAGLIADPASTWLRLDENPTQEAIRAAVRLLPPHFLVNVTLDPAGAITGVFAGDWELAHRLGTDFCGRHSTFPVVGHYRLALTTNGGHPLDQNLYQTVKGMSAAARLLAPGGTLVIASACTAGVPDFGGFGAMLGRHPRPEHFLAGLDLTAPAAHDQWEAQALAQLLVQHRIELYSSLPTERVRRAWLEPVADLSRRMTELLDANAQERLALMPRGPLAVPVPADAPPTA
jgi:nickel-dependent lactate racemase